MRIRPILLLGLGIGIVLFGAAKTMEVMGEENTIVPCLVAALIATVLLQAVRRQHLWDRLRVFTNGGWLVHRSP